MSRATLKHRTIFESLKEYEVTVDIHNGRVDTKTSINSATVLSDTKATIDVVIDDVEKFGTNKAGATSSNDGESKVQTEAGVKSAIQHRGDGKIRILQYNVAGLPPSINKSKPRERSIEIAKRINEREFDVVCFQEVFDAEVEANLRDGLHKTFPWIAIPPRTRKSRVGSFPLTSGLMIASRFPIVRAHFLPFKGCIGSDAFATKGVLYVQLALRDALPSVNLDPTTPEPIMHLLTLHVQADPDPAPLWWVYNRYQRARLIRGENLRVMQRYAQEIYKEMPAPLVVCGDMNEEQDGKGYKDRPKMMEILNRFHDTYRLHHSMEEKGYTVDDSLCDLTPVRPNETEVGNKKRLDYILLFNPDKEREQRSPAGIGNARDADAGVKGGNTGSAHALQVTSESVEVIPMEFEGSHPSKEPNGKYRCLSDHFGVEAVFGLRMRPTDTGVRQEAAPASAKAKEEEPTSSKTPPEPQAEEKMEKEKKLLQDAEIGLTDIAL